MAPAQSAYLSGRLRHVVGANQPIQWYLEGKVAVIHKEPVCGLVRPIMYKVYMEGYVVLDYPI